MPADNSGAGRNEVLSQSEVEQLLSQVAEDQASAPPPPPAPAPPVAASADGLRRHDFRGASLLTTAELRRARLRHDEFARSLATRLSIYLRLEVGVQVAALQTLPHPKFIDGLPKVSHVTLFRIEPLPGIGLLSVPLNLSLAILDRLLGGPGVAGQTEGSLTEIDVTVLDLVVQLVLKEWGQHVARLPDAPAQILGHETNPCFLPPAPSDLQMLLLSLEARLGDCGEQVQLALPFPAVESVVRQPDPSAQFRRAIEAQADRPSIRWQPGLADVKVPLSAGWDGIEITAQQLAHLKVGDVLPLEPDRFNRVRVRLARVSKFIGRLGASNHVRAVELTAPLASENLSSS
jgi:flagellar motor switch protein FliM